MLGRKKENQKIITLYYDSVKLFSLNPDYEFIIYLFIKLCENVNNFKDIIKKLLDEFWDKTKNNELNFINQKFENFKLILKK